MDKINYVDYFNGYKYLEVNASNANDVASRDSLKKYGPKLVDLASNISNINIETDWKDSAGFTFNEVKGFFATIITNVSDIISNEGAESEKAYVQLNKILVDFKLLQEEYNSYYHDREPKKTDYRYIGENNEFLDWKYNEDCNLYLNAIAGYDLKLKGYADDVDLILDFLNTINGLDPKKGSKNLKLDLSSNDIIIDTTGIPFVGEPTVLTGEALQEFLRDNNISGNSLSLTVMKGTVCVNGVEFEACVVYDNTLPDHTDYNKYVANCLEKAAYIDEPVLSYISDHGTDMLFYESRACDNGALQYYSACAGYCNSINRNIVMMYPGDSEFEYYTDATVHELGHAYDFALYSEETGLNAQTYQDLPVEERPTEYFGHSGTYWKETINEEAANFDGWNTSPYSEEAYYDAHVEYFADSFQEYYLPHQSGHTREEFEYVTPKTYALMEEALDIARGDKNE